MNRPTTRREFLATAGYLGALSALGPACASQGSAAQEGESEPLFRISLAQWSLHRTLAAGRMQNLDFAPRAMSDHGIEAVEYVNSFFKDKAEDREYLAEMKRRADDAGVRSLLIMIDGEGQLADADSQKRARAIENHHRWVEAAHRLGCHSIRVNAGGSGEPQEQAARAADSLRKLAEFADGFGLNVLVENHGGHSSDGAWLAGVMRAADHPRVGTLPDFGNFRIRGDEWYDRYQGVAELMPFARAVSAKSHEFDEEGNETRTDYRRMMKIVLDAGYRGFVGIEYEGGGHSEEEGIRLTKSLLERVREELGREAEGG